MTSLSASNFRRPTLSQGLLFLLILLCCTVDTSRRMSIAGVSGLGALTLAAGGAVWAAWLMRPVLPRGLLTIILPLIFFQIDALGTLIWYRPGMDGVQLATIGLTFLAVLMVTARETYANPDLAPLLHRAMLISSALPVLAWMTIILSGRVSGDELNLTRPFALYTLPIGAVALATWLGSNRPTRQRRPIRWKTLLPLLWALLIAYVVLLGLSRTALVGILLMIPLSVALRGNGKSILYALLILAVGAGSFLAVLYSDQHLYNRFFHEDAHLKVGGLAINGSGRTQIWNMLLSTIGSDWVFGKGISSSEDMVNRYFNNVGQPHNDYIRFYYDQGIVGLGIWLLFVTQFVYRSFSWLRRSFRDVSADYPMHLAALLAVASVSFSMLTDNSVCYTFVMVPLAIVMGCSLGTGAARTALARVPEAVELQRPISPPPPSFSRPACGAFSIGTNRPASGAAKRI
jgi:O-antigen ligase